MKLCKWIKESIPRLVINSSLEKEETVVCCREKQLLKVVLVLCAVCFRRSGEEEKKQKHKRGREGLLMNYSLKQRLLIVHGRSMTQTVQLLA